MKATSPNWRAFYEQLGVTGPQFLINVQPSFRELVGFEARTTDAFWSDSLEEILTSFWEQGPRVAVWEAVKEWANNVREYQTETYGPNSLIPWDKFEINKTSQIELQEAINQFQVEFNQELIDELVKAAKEPEEEATQEIVANLLIQGIIQPYQKHAEGTLIRALEIPWRKVIGHLGRDWSLAFQISSRQWEELIAAAFHQEKYDEVILTPRSGDHGRDVIAIKKGVGSVRIINSVKAYKPGKLVRYDDVRALAGVLLGDPKASKGIITTTSDFPPNILNDPYIAPLMPFRLELMNGSKLKRWLADIAKT